MIHEQRMDVQVLDTLIVVVSFSTGQWTVTALQLWFNYVGEKYLRETEAAARQQLLAPFSAALPTNRQGISQLCPQPLPTVGARIMLEPGDIIPADGVIITGYALIDEQRLTGNTRPVEKEASDPVFAMTVLLAGHISLVVERTGKDTVAAQIDAALQHAASHETRFQVQRTAATHQIIGWMLSIGGLATLFTGVNTAAALSDARFGYDSAMLTPLALLRYLKLALQNGLLVKDGHSFERMAAVNTLVFDARVMQHAAAAATICALRQRGLAYIYLISTEDDPIVENLGAALGLDGILTAAKPQVRLQVIQQLQAEGKIVCLVGDGMTDAAMQQADVAVSLGSLATLADDKAQVILLDERLDRITQLYDLAKQWQVQVRTLSQVTFLPGLLTVASTLFLHTGLMIAVLIDAGGHFAGIYTAKFLAASKRDEMAENGTIQPSIEKREA